MTQLVLVVDDSPDVHDLIEVGLRAEGVVLYRALDGNQGLALASERRPDLILLDLDLPDMGGLMICRVLKDTPELANIPIIVLTSTTEMDIKLEAFELGAVDYITKPFDRVELRARVRAALRTKRYQDLLATRAQLDALTGLWNRSYFDARLREELATAHRHKLAISMMMLDIDHFKKVNDTHGHPFGDAVIQRVAEVLTATIRVSDILCRYGGEEFAIILPNVACDAAVQAGERIRARIAAIRLSKAGVPVSVTASIGVADHDPTTGTIAPDYLVEAADRALYLAKSSGRNCVQRSARN
jgi:diguanylate cyclase (GGDEF)-like protein